MRIFVTGAAGFIGSEFCRQARSLGHEILPLLRPHRLDNLPHEAIKSFSPETVVHCAWIATPGVYTDSPENVVLQNQSSDLFQYLSRIGVRHFIGCGTCAEYADSTAPLDEDRSKLSPVTPYARAKHALHSELEKLAREHSVALSWARIFYPYGKNEHPDRLISSLLRGHKTGSRYSVRTPDAVRDYVHVEDVASALLTLVERQAAGSFNIGTGHGVRLGTLESMVASLVGNERFVEPESGFSENSSRDRVVASVAKLRSLGWSPSYNVRAGLSSYFRDIAEI